MKILLLLAIGSISICTTTLAQAVWTIQDHFGNDILLNKDSSFLTVENDLLFMYAIDKQSDSRNILVTTGDTTFWLFDTGFGKDLPFTSFINRFSDELVFGINGIWYLTKGTPSSTHVFYDNHDPGSIYEYLNIYEFSAVNIDGYNLAIEAIEKASGDTIILYHNSEFNSTTVYGKKLRVIEDNLPSFGPYEGSFFIGSVYNDISQSWGGVGLYREYSSSLRLLLPLGVKQTYETNYVASGRIVDYQDNGTKKVYQYNESVDSCLEVTPSLFPNHTLFDYQSLKWTTFGYPLEPERSYYDYYWKGRDQSGIIKYYTTAQFGDQLEIIDLRNVGVVDFIHSDYTTDTIYYYNYSNTQRGLIRYNLYDGGTKKDQTTIAFDEDYKLRGYLSKIYYGRYNPQSGKIEASVKDFLNNGEYSFLESTNGIRIEGPTDFTFLDDKVFVHSRTSEGLKLVVYDPNGIVAVRPDLHNNPTLSISPNPSSGVFNIKLDISEGSHRNIEYIISTDQGIVLDKKMLTDNDFTIDLSGHPVGKYNLTLIFEGANLYTTSLILVQK